MMHHGSRILVGLESDVRATYGTGRFCATCGVPLSVYNPDLVCWVHRHDADAPEYDPHRPVEHHVATYDASLKRCSGCKAWKPRTPEHYNRSARSQDGLQHYCKPCKNANRRKYTRMKPPPPPDCWDRPRDERGYFLKKGAT
jgi:hypothetical protein